MRNVEPLPIFGETSKHADPRESKNSLFPYGVLQIEFNLLALPMKFSFEIIRGNGIFLLPEFSLLLLVMKSNTGYNVIHIFLI